LFLINFNECGSGDIQRLAKIVSLEDLPLTKEFQSDWPLHVSVNGVQQCQAKNGVQPQCLSPPTVKASATYLKPMVGFRVCNQK
jgi:hypothetical protein